MTVHCVEVMTSADADQTNVQNKINDLKSKYGETLPEQNADLENTERTLNFDTGETVQVLHASFRVFLGDNSDKITEKNDLLEQIRKEADKSASWWQVRWHECTHSGDPRTVEKTRTLSDGTTETYTEEVMGCEWQETQHSNINDIPDEVEF